MTRHDERVRPAHASLHGKIFRYNDPIWKSVYPPNGWNCRCYVTPLTLEEMQAEGTYVPPVESEHHRTEFIKTVPEEFRRNPGLEEHIFTKWAEQKFKDMPIEKAEEIKRKVEEFNKKEPGLTEQEFNKLYESFVKQAQIKEHISEYKNTDEFISVLAEGKKLGLTEKETTVIHSYTSRPFADLNKELRADNNIPEHLRVFEKLLNHSLSKIKSETGFFFRGVGNNINPEVDFKLFSDYKQNAVITEKAFLSTSKGKNVYPHRNVEFIVESKTGKSIEKISASPEESEVLNTSKKNFKIIKRWIGLNPITGTSKLFIKMKEL